MEIKTFTNPITNIRYTLERLGAQRYVVSQFDLDAGEYIEYTRADTCAAADDRYQLLVEAA